MKQRNADIDYLKSVFILLMVTFHLVYVGDMYPYAKQVVYTFHMPAFLLLSGYLVRTDRPLFHFLRKVGWIFVPYAVMETGYVLLSAVLPVREPVHQLSISVLADKLLLHPLGPYWYLHTLMLCYLTTYLAHRLFPSRPYMALLCAAVGLSLLSYGAGLLSPANALYFLLGWLLARSGNAAHRLLYVSGWTLCPLVLLCLFPANLDRSTPAGMLIVYLVFCFLLWTARKLPLSLRRFTDFIGANTWSIFLFSPIFTMAFKWTVPIFAFDPTAMLFLAVALTGTVAGSLAIAWCMDRLGVSRYFCGRPLLAGNPHV